MPPRQSGASQSQGAFRRRAAQEVDEDDEEEDRAYEDVAETQGGGRGNLSDEDIRTKAAVIVRLALFNEYKKRPISHQELRKHVNAPRGFNAVFEYAQTQLKNTFGMELVDTRAKHTAKALLAAQQKGKGRANGNAEDGEDDAEASSPKKKKDKSTPSTRSYILRSTLPTDLLAMMSQTRVMPQVEYEEDSIREDVDVQDSGALIRWEKSDGTPSGHIALLGIRTIILCLILCLGRVIQDDHLHALLRRLNLHRETVLPYNSTDNKEPHMTLDKYLDLLEKQRYLEKSTIPNPNGSDEAAVIEWRWGSREVEFSEKAAAAFIENVFYGDENDDQSDSEEEDDRRQRRNGGRDREAERTAKRQKLREDIAKAAGGPLQGQL